MEAVASETHRVVDNKDMVLLDMELLDMEADKVMHREADTATRTKKRSPKTKRVTTRRK